MHVSGGLFVVSAWLRIYRLNALNEEERRGVRGRERTFCCTLYARDSSISDLNNTIITFTDYVIGGASQPTATGENLL